MANCVRCYSVMANCVRRCKQAFPCAHHPVLMSTTSVQGKNDITEPWEHYHISQTTEFCLILMQVPDIYPRICRMFQSVFLQKILSCRVYLQAWNDKRKNFHNYHMPEYILSPLRCMCNKLGLLEYPQISQEY